MLTYENIQRGMVPIEAKRAARIRFDGSHYIRATNLEFRGLFMLDTFLQDVRHAARLLCKNPGFKSRGESSTSCPIGVSCRRRR
jgi:hypothetical protein